MDGMQFSSDGLTYTCQPESSIATPDVVWWWVTVSGDVQRYAAFRTEKGETQASLKPRVIKYYAEVLAIRARPRITRPPWNAPRPKPAEAAATPEPQLVEKA
ncbi:MAG TPA: hypothetical protein VNC11_06460 [Gemmatimonadaceae bacterium]|jgi:hypothetical protein|nr:hypothetical protein [Gemmatimonadaceae bacterium]